jgi:triosephosphate isomerase
MLVEAGVEYVVIGHSERRQYFAETDQTVNLRTLAALNAGLKAIVCVGETLEQRELGYTETLLKFQTKMALTNVSAEQLKNVIVAYEPVWAIGTGVPLPLIRLTRATDSFALLSLRLTVLRLQRLLPFSTVAL